MSAKNAEFDAIDRDLIDELRREGRASYTELAKRVNLSPNAVAERMRRLTGSGVIRGFAAEVALEALGFSLLADIEVKLRADTPADGFERAVERIPGIVRMTLTTGNFDYTLRVACADQADLMRFVEALRKAVPVAETHTRVVLKERTILLRRRAR